MVGAAVFGPSWDSDPGALFQPKPSRSSVTCERPQPHSRPQRAPALSALPPPPRSAQRSHWPPAKGGWANEALPCWRRGSGGGCGGNRRCAAPGGAAGPEGPAPGTRGSAPGTPREPPGNLPGAAPACRGRPREVSVPSARPRGGAAGVWALPGEGSESPAWAASPAPLPPRSRGRWRTWAQPPPGPACRPPAEPRPCPSVQSDRVSVNTACAEVRRIFAMLKKNQKKKPQKSSVFSSVYLRCLDPKCSKSNKSWESPSHSPRFLEIENTSSGCKS